MAMAAKAAKREAAASRWVHALDSMHVNTPLLECVDLDVSLVGGGSRMIRVQVYAQVAVTGCHVEVSQFEYEHEVVQELQRVLPVQAAKSTLRVGSCDACKSLHVDEAQMHDVVRPLAAHFYLGSCM